MGFIDLRYTVDFWKDFFGSIFGSKTPPPQPVSAVKNEIIAPKPVASPANSVDGKQYLSTNFTFEELTITSQTDLLAKNREEAKDFMVPLTSVAKTLLQPIKDHFKVSLKINSGYRGKTLNERVGGSLTSQHCKGEAVDFNVEGYETRSKQIEVIKWIMNEPSMTFGQLLLEKGCVHISLGSKKEIAEYDVPTKTKKPIKELKS